MVRSETIVADSSLDGVSVRARPIPPPWPARRDGDRARWAEGPLLVVSRGQLGAAAPSTDPTSPWCGKPAFYDLAAAGRAPLRLHPSRVVRFLGTPLPDPWAAATPWSDSVLQALYDAVHAAALTTAGATSLMHEAKVDIVRGSQEHQCP